ncbi:MAG: hypothetical protein FWC19_08380 [Treponema sp.]|nr:hypothetical protein [Treponema sp.]
METTVKVDQFPVEYTPVKKAVIFTSYKISANGGAEDFLTEAEELNIKTEKSMEPSP